MPTGTENKVWGGINPVVPAGATSNSRLLRAALRKAGVTLAPGRGPSVDQYQEAIDEENRMIGSWNCSPLTILGKRITLWTTEANKQSYTIGIDPTGTNTADWSGLRPQQITEANLLLPGATDPIEQVRRPIAVLLSQRWAEIRYQGVYTYPEALFYLYNDPNYPPFGRIYFRPIPDAAYQVELFTWQAIPKFAGLEDAVLLPDGYEDAIVNNLAVRLASMPWTVQVPMNPQVRVDAQLSLAAIQQMNAAAPPLKTEGQLRRPEGFYNWMSGLTE